jgi:hypothetical protein
MSSKNSQSAAPQRAVLLSKLNQLTGNGADFEALAVDIFRYQAENNPLYGRFLSLLGRNPAQIDRIDQIPFLPISFFKTHRVQTGEWSETTVFTSSGTTGQTPSQHLVRDVDLYTNNCVRGFTPLYGPPENWLVLALLPAYLERTGSSLVVMADDFIRRSRFPESGFFLNNLAELADVLARRAPGTPVLLLGVSFALLDFAEQFPLHLSGVTIMETGGMKGRRKEITRSELHAILTTAFGVEAIHSEYGMTELFSQGYARGGSVFTPSATMRVVTTEINDPFCGAKPGKPGQVNIVDLANIDTCSFIATEDLGRSWPDGTFEILGRMDTAEMRGCNLMVE